MQPILRLAATLKAESEQRTYPSTPRMANMALFRYIAQIIMTKIYVKYKI